MHKMKQKYVKQSLPNYSDVNVQQMFLDRNCMWVFLAVNPLPGPKKSKYSMGMKNKISIFIEACLECIFITGPRTPTEPLRSAELQLPPLLLPVS